MLEGEVDLEQLRTHFADESVKGATKEERRSKTKREQSKDVVILETSVSKGAIAKNLNCLMAIMKKGVRMDWGFLRNTF